MDAGRAEPAAGPRREPITSAWDWLVSSIDQSRRELVNISTTGRAWMDMILGD